MVFVNPAGVNVTKAGLAAYVINLLAIPVVLNMVNAKMAPVFVHKAGTDVIVHYVSIISVTLNFLTHFKIIILLICIILFRVKIVYSTRLFA